jgi:hypothetical protein
MDALFSKMVKSGRTTYFMDVWEAKNNSKYVTLTASQPSQEDPKKFTKRSVVVFGNAADEFAGALKEARALLEGTEPYSRTVKSGKMTYFLDVKEAKNKSKYVSITSSSPSKEDPQKFTKNSIAVFDNAAEEFVGAFEETLTKMKE